MFIYCDHVHALFSLLLTPVFPQLVHLLLSWCFFFFFDLLSLVRAACMSTGERLFTGAWQLLRGLTAEENDFSPRPRLCPSLKRK